MAAVRGPLRSDSSACHADQSPAAGSGTGAAAKRGRCACVRSLAGSSGSNAVTMARPGGIFHASGCLSPNPRTNHAPSRSARTMLKLR